MPFSTAPRPRDTTIRAPMPPMRQKRRSYEEEAKAVPPAVAPPALPVLVCCKRSMDIIQVPGPPLDSRGPHSLEDLLTSRLRAAAAGRAPCERPEGRLEASPSSTARPSGPAARPDGRRGRGPRCRGRTWPGAGRRAWASSPFTETAKPKGARGGPLTLFPHRENGVARLSRAQAVHGPCAPRR